MPRRTVPLSARALHLPTRPVLEVEAPASRGVTCVNVRREDKALFDELQSWWSFTHGQPLSQWDTFTLLLAAALGNGDADLPPRRP